MKRLIDNGFRPVGRWTMLDGCIRIALTELANVSNILYAFVANDEVLYVGKTTQKLQARLYGYQNPGPRQSTNIKANHLISELLNAGQSVEILALPDNGLLRFGIFHLNLAAGLEDSIVRTIRPKWNRIGKNR
jgi:hypothetical protein